MEYINRQISSQIERGAKYFPVIVVTGPRQSGKSTLCNHLFDTYKKYNLEDVGLRDIVNADPKGFLAECGDHVIIDEVQHVPQLMSYIQVAVDNDESRRFVLTGSSNFALLQSITQSLAGRAAVYHLLPLALNEVPAYASAPTNALLFNGMYPSVITEKRPADLFYSNYFTTYVERDVRQVKNITDISQFQLFMRLTAGRTGSEFNASQLANEVGVTSPTIKGWMSVLQTSYIAFLLPPYFANINKRLTKTPKVYFYDTGLLCYLLGIENAEQLTTHPLRGAVFKNMAILELLKERFNNAKDNNLTFYRENAGREADIVQINGDDLSIFEVKSSATFNKSFLKNLNYLDELLAPRVKSKTIVYDGETVRPLAVNIRQLVP